MQQAPEYFELEGIPGILVFRCVPLQATLQASSCAERWKVARTNADPRFDKCRGCPIGAAHAGETVASTSSLCGQKVCGRCHRTSERLICRHLCVSCYNRQREYKVGRNGKGRPPVRLKQLEARTIHYWADGSLHRRRLDLTVDSLEPIVAVLRDSQHTVAFGFHGRPALTPGIQ